MAAATFPNLIAGDKLESTDRNLNINPSNTADVVGEFTRAGYADLDRAIESFSREGRTRTPARA